MVIGRSNARSGGYKRFNGKQPLDRLHLVYTRPEVSLHLVYTFTYVSLNRFTLENVEMSVHHYTGKVKFKF